MLGLGKGGVLGCVHSRGRVVAVGLFWPTGCGGWPICWWHCGHRASGEAVLRRGRNLMCERDPVLCGDFSDAGFRYAVFGLVTLREVDWLCCLVAVNAFQVLAVSAASSCICVTHGHTILQTRP